MIINQLDADRYIWSGDAASFDITFEVKIEAGKAKYLRVSWVNIGGTETVGVEGVHYTVAGVRVHMAALSNPSPSGYTLVLQRNTSITQEVDLIKNGVTDLETLERMADKLTMILQEIAAIRERSLRRPVSDEGPWGDLPPELTRSNKFLAFDVDGVPMAAAGVPDLPTTGWAAGLLQQPDQESARDYIGAATDLEEQLFWKGTKVVTESTTLTADVNWMTIGPITIAAGVEVTVEGSWVIV